MIISKTPLRVSFVGGGTDLKSFYQHEYGQVVSTAINKYIYIAVHSYFEDKILLKYSEKEQVDSVNKIKHPLIRECMKQTRVLSGVEITSIADIPGGTGLGSSSAFTVGLLNALYAYKGEKVSAERLAREAAEIEINRVGAPIGKQDHYIAAYGGFRKIRFNEDESVNITPVNFRDKQRFNESLFLIYTAKTRDANKILKKQSEITPKKHNDKFQVLIKMRNQTEEITKFIENGEFSKVGILLNEAWKLKSSLGNGISNGYIKELYQKGINAGALGGKLLGAGGGGFILFYCDKIKQKIFLKEFEQFKTLNFKFEGEGSKIILCDE